MSAKLGALVFVLLASLPAVAATPQPIIMMPALRRKSRREAPGSAVSAWSMAARAAGEMAEVSNESKPGRVLTSVAGSNKSCGLIYAVSCA